MDLQQAIVVDVKKVYVAWSNTDSTGGCGEEIPFCVCELEETAKRLGKKNGVMGSDCRVTERRAVRIAGICDWLIPGRIISPSKEDKELAMAKISFESALKKAKELGLTNDEIASLRRGSSLAHP